MTFSDCFHKRNLLNIKSQVKTDSLHLLEFQSIVFNLSISFVGQSSTKQGIKCLAQLHNTCFHMGRELHKQSRGPEKEIE